jgi:hypothetical protein
MEAIAHNSAFAKKAGVPQSVGKDFAAADKGKKFAGGGAATQKINRQDTQHGAMDMPFKSLKKFTGMKAGGKVRRFDGEEGSFVDKRPFAETNATEDRTVTRSVPGSAPSYPSPQKSTGSADFKSAFAAARKEGGKTFDYNGKSYSTDLAKPSKDMGDESARMLARAPRKETVTEKVPTPAVTGRADKVSKNMPSESEKEARGERGAEMIGAAVSMLPFGRAVTGATRAMRAGESASRAAMNKAASGTAKQVERKTSAGNPENWNRVSQAERDRIAGRTSSRPEDWNNISQSERNRIAGYKKGGKVGTKKPNPFMEMIAKKKEKAEGESPSFQKKEGKKGEKAEMKFAKGGMTGYSKGGNMNAKGSMSGSSRAGENTKVQKKGLTEGKVIKMASGGSVSSRADGIASRGKTNCKIC